MSAYYTIEIKRNGEAALHEFPSEAEALKSYSDTAWASDGFLECCAANVLDESDPELIWEFAASDLETFERFPASELREHLGARHGFRLDSQIMEALSRQAEA